MDGWVGLVDGWTDGWMVGWMFEWMDGWMDGWTGGRHTVAKATVKSGLKSTCFRLFPILTTCSTAANFDFHGC